MGSEILSIRHLNFADVEQLLAETEGFDFALADLGVSSYLNRQSRKGIYL